VTVSEGEVRDGVPHDANIDDQAAAAAAAAAGAAVLCTDVELTMLPPNDRALQTVAGAAVTLPRSPASPKPLHPTADLCAVWGTAGVGQCLRRLGGDVSGSAHPHSRHISARLLRSDLRQRVSPPSWADITRHFFTDLDCCVVNNLWTPYTAHVMCRAVASTV